MSARPSWSDAWQRPTAGPGGESRFVIVDAAIAGIVADRVPGAVAKRLKDGRHAIMGGSPGQVRAAIREAMRGRL